MVSFNDVHYVERMLDAAGITQRELSVYMLLIIFFLMGYVARLMFRFQSNCKGVMCSDIKKIHETSDKVLIIVGEISEEIKVDRIGYRENLSRIRESIDRLEVNILDLRNKSYELSGMVFSTKNVSFDMNRIRHHED